MYSSATTASSPERFKIRLMVWWIALFFLIGGCGGQGTEGGAVTVHLTLQALSSNKLLFGKTRPAPLPAEITLLQLDVTGPGLDPISKSLSPSDENKNAAGEIVLTIEVPAGASRRFAATAFDRQNTALFQGDVTRDIVSGSAPELVLVLEAVGLPSEPSSEAPEAPQNVSAAQQGLSGLTLSWDPVSGADAYTVYIASLSGVKKNNFGSFPDGKKYDGAISPLTLSELKTKTYCIVVTATGAGGESVESSEVCVSIVPFTRIEIAPEQVNLAVGTTRSLSAVATTSSGNTVDPVSIVWQSLDPSIAGVDANGVVTGHQIGVTTLIAAVGTLKATAAVGVVSPAPGRSNLNLSGTVLYEDKPYNVNGFTGQPVPTPVRGAMIHLIAIDGFTKIATGATGLDGTFTFSNLDNSARRGGVYLQVISKTEPNNPNQIELRNNAADQALLSLISSAYDDSSGTSLSGLSITATAAGIGGAFNILDVFSTASDLIRQEGGLCTPPAVTACTPPLLVAFWEPGSKEGTFYDDQLDAVFILGGDAQGDTDEYDDSVIAHEYGHFAARHFSRDDSLGGGHFITDHDQDIRLSWSEGWGSFFSSAVRKDATYVDTTTRGTTFSFNLENDSSPQIFGLNSAAVYTTSEIAVAGVLWDIFDGPTIPSSIAEPHDPLSLGFGPIWQSLLQFTNGTPATLETFRFQFESIDPGSAAGLQSILTERKIELFPDAFEAGETALVVNGSAQHHTLYQASPAPPQNDEDVIPFSVQAGVQYTLETFNLTNGADTLLTLTDT
ncbi:MAG: hypothetical protein EPO39_04145, partial [Candidatus Manganitrophaceae bacterium]